MHHEYPTTHFDLDLIADSGQAFRWVRTDAGHYRIPADGRLCDVSQEDEMVVLECDPADEPFWWHYLSLDEDYDDIFDSLCAAGTDLDMMVRSMDGVRVLHQPLLEAVVTFMTSQNNNIPRIRKSIERMCGGPLEPFPSPDELVARLEEDDCGLGYRRFPIRDMALDWEGLAGRLIGSYDEDRATLMEVYGIGPKVADCICLFGLGHRCAYPVDTWMRKADAAYDLPRVEGLEGIEQQFIFAWMRQRGGR